MEYHARVLSEQLKLFASESLRVRYVGQTLTRREIERCDVLHLISSPLPQLLKARSTGKPVVYHWIGSDVLRIIKDTPLRRRLKKMLIDIAPAIHLAVYEPLRDELAEIGIHSQHFPLVQADFPDEPFPLPKDFAVLCYLPAQRWEFYYGDRVMEIARWLPDIQFHIVAAQSAIGAPGNVSFHGYVEDMKFLYRQSNALIRLTHHDGLSKMVLEALAYGRHVLWNHPFPHCYRVDTVEEITEKLLLLSKTNTINLSGHNFVKQHYHPKVLAKRYVDLYYTIIRQAND